MKHIQKNSRKKKVSLVKIVRLIRNTNVVAKLFIYLQSKKIINRASCDSDIDISIKKIIIQSKILLDFINKYFVILYFCK